MSICAAGSVLVNPVHGRNTSTEKDRVDFVDKPKNRKIKLYSRGTNEFFFQPVLVFDSALVDIWLWSGWGESGAACLA